MSREKAREALKRMPELEAKVREQQRLIDELHDRLIYDAYEHRRQTAKSHGVECSRCGQKLIPGQEVLQMVDDDGSVVAQYHYPDCQHPWQGSRESREAGQRRGRN